MCTTKNQIIGNDICGIQCLQYQKRIQDVPKKWFNNHLIKQWSIVNIHLFTLLMLIMFGIQSCTTVHVYQIGGPQGREMANQPSTEWVSDVSNTFLYGAIRDDVPIKNCALGDGTRINIEEIKIEKNIWRIVLYIITLGLWDSSKISWRCAKPCNP